MRIRHLFVISACLVGTDRALAQGDSSPFRRLDLPAANEYRTGSGRPGPKYWQQKASYSIKATLDPAQNEVRGTETVHYVNHSPDALPYLWFFVEQNLCEAQSITNVLNQPPLKFLDSEFDFSCQGFAGGGHLAYIRLAGHGASSPDLKHVRYGTTMRVDLPRRSGEQALRVYQFMNLSGNTLCYLSL